MGNPILAAGRLNTRVKLAALGNCGKLAFVNVPIRRRSLPAIRGSDA